MDIYKRGKPNAILNSKQNPPPQHYHTHNGKGHPSPQIYIYNYVHICICRKRSRAEIGNEIRGILNILYSVEYVVGMHGYGQNLVARTLRNVLVAWSLDPIQGNLKACVLPRTWVGAKKQNSR